MAWTQNSTAKMANALRFTVRGSLLISAIALSFSLTYIIIKTCFFFVDYLNHTLFSGPWY